MASVDNQNAVLAYGTNSYVGNLRLNTGICPFADYPSANNARFEWAFGGNPSISPYALPTGNFGTVGHGLYTAVWGLTINTSAYANSPGWHEIPLVWHGCADYPWTVCTDTTSGQWGEVDFQFYISAQPPPPPAPVKPTVSAVCSGTTSTINISWGGSSTGTAGGFSADISAPNNSSHTANNYYSKNMGLATSTSAPGGFNLWPGGTPAMPALVPGATYWAWVWNGSLSPISNAVVARDCTPPVPSCGTNVIQSPSPAAPTQPFSITVYFTLSKGAIASTNYTITLSIPGVTPSTSSKSGTIPIGGTGSGNITFSGLSGPTTGSYPGTYTVSNGVSLVCPFDGLGGHPPPPTIASKPYLRVYSGDVVTGSGFGPSSCTPNASAGITAYNKGAAGSYGGAGVQFAAQAMVSIMEFTSASLRSGLPTPNPAKGLTFANNAADTYGGSFGTAPCASDYYGNISAAATPGPATYAGNPSLSGKTVLKYNGDVVISNNVIYAGGTWTTTTIPSLYLVTQGNIYIASTVTNLDGVYVAIPTSPNNGRIYTCSSGFAPMTINASYYANCHSPLTINGAFVASRVVFGRTNGDVFTAPANESGTSTNIAEKFIYSPEIWLTGGPTASTVIKYDSITGLPPVL
ncbi:MAG TPA: hypothetical protein VLE69_01960 [Candidatus Saccharimonadales bacterium]|nr:hypothetical protein [Candidatus Saccharimonadales bacterium]